MQFTIQNCLEQKAQKYADKIIKLPFVQMVVLTGSVAKGRATDKSDIDYLVITKRGRLYLTRAIIVIMAKIKGEYRSNNDVAGKLCLNWFLTDNLSFDINELKIEFKLKINNFKFNEDNIGKVKLLSERDQENQLEKWLAKGFGNLLERLAKNYQIWRIKKDPRTRAKGSMVRWSDNELGFHPPRE